MKPFSGNLPKHSLANCDSPDGMSTHMDLACENDLKLSALT